MRKDKEGHVFSIERRADGQEREIVGFETPEGVEEQLEQGTISGRYLTDYGACTECLASQFGISSLDKFKTDVPNFAGMTQLYQDFQKRLKETANGQKS